ncbi:aminodeoxychorismate synthase component I [Nitrobacter sp.]|uniref:aminodeoxychorismate synthase component I n=1 Tax=Nitrobacter sp. TaxID=29420 RepID=UPI001D8EA11C|nr:aminodeoxychorismate synthase component I [Nitrobacter sp.]MCB1393969.1 aminodeoxychorismate synthase component I [Nitrobacter sp.]
MRTLIIDNYDSFTYNLVHLIAEINQEEPLVVRNDATTWDELSRRPFDNIIISPGPGRPDRAADFGLSQAAIEAAALPLLGVCLGHQGLALASGASLARAPSLVHGRTSRIVHQASGLFAGMPPLFSAARYHSFVVQRPLPPALEEIAWTEDGLVMGIARHGRPQWGVQFHPESFLTEDGRILLRNFRDLSFRCTGRTSTPPPARADKQRAAPPATTTRKAFWLEIPRAIDTETVFCSLFADQPFAFWLDSNLGGTPLSRWSYMGDATGPHAQTVQYRSADRMTLVDDARGHRTENVDIFAYLQREHSGRPQSAPPCPFVGGHVGWFGYELRHDCGSPTTRRAVTPDALWIRSDRFIAVDHREGKTYVCAIDSPDEAARAQHWIRSTLKRIESAKRPPLNFPYATDRDPLAFLMKDGRESYLSKVARCLDLIAQGETYQVCLTSELSCAATVEPLRVYRAVRNVNPAPFAAFLKWPGGAVLSASPERFLAVDTDRNIEAKPIKGTIRRATDPLEDQKLAEILRAGRKNRAENGMIVDLLRHDLSRCCETGSVSVRSLFNVETYQTVHQLVSTIRGTLKPEYTLIDVLRSGAFPGGSMTGTPKSRTLELIDQLEQRARGIYSGSLGWLGDDGAADLSIVIRSIVLADGRFSIGVGGGVVAESTPEGEFEEMLLKAEASIKSIVLATFGSFSERQYRLAEPGDRMAQN